MIEIENLNQFRKYLILALNILCSLNKDFHINIKVLIL